MREPIHFFYATLPGICFQLGTVTLFAPLHSTTVHVIDDISTLHLTHEIQGPVRNFIAGDIENRLEALGGRQP